MSSIRLPLPARFLPLEERVRLLEEAWLSFPIIHVVTGAPAEEFSGWTAYGGLTIDRSVFRELLPDYKWYVYAAGLVDPGDANTATIGLDYTKDNMVSVSLGSTTKSGSGWVKFSMGPFDVFGTSGVPTTETVACVRLSAQKSGGTSGYLDAVCIWTRFLPARQ